VEASLTLQNGSAVTVDTSSGTAKLSGWRHFVLTYDGQTAKIYVNGQLATSSTTAGGFIADNENAVILGNGGYQGYADEVHIYNRVLPVAEVVQRFNMVPNMKPNQPLVPRSDIADFVSGAVAVSTDSIGVSYNFKFQAIDLQADNLTYIIDWDYDLSNDTVSANTQTVSGVPSGQVVEARHSWTQVGRIT